LAERRLPPDLARALGRVEWADGKTLVAFVHAVEPVGYFRFEDVGRNFSPRLRMPPYAGSPGGSADSVAGQDLRRLGYEQGRIERGDGRLVYRQIGWGGFHYDIAVTWAAVLKVESLGKKRGIGPDSRPDFVVDPKSGLMFAPGVPYDRSPRHFSHLLAFHPFGLIDMADGADDRTIIRNTLATLDRVGPDWWCGYSYAWLGNLKARAFDGEGAAEALRTFAAAFCLPNGFHVNGDQTKSGKSKFTYRPFTLEGNFAFASGLQAMLLQSHAGVVRVFPAGPATWKNAEFRDLRAQGAFLVSARRCLCPQPRRGMPFSAHCLSKKTRGRTRSPVRFFTPSLRRPTRRRRTRLPAFILRASAGRLRQLRRPASSDPASLAVRVVRAKPDRSARPSSRFLAFHTH